MSIPINLDQKLELRDASGSTVGFVLPEQFLRDLLAERDALRKEVAELQEQLTALRDRAARVEAERDGYLESLHFLTRKDVVPFTEQELADLQKNGMPFDQIIPEIEQIVGLKASGG